MSEPMVSHDCVAFYLLTQEVAKHVKVVQSGQGADEVFAGYHWYPPMGEPARPSLDGSVASYRAAFFDRDPAGVAALRHRGATSPTTIPADCSSPSTSPAPAPQTGVDRALRLDTTVMLVDDPVKRVDNMTMAWGLEGRVPFLDHELVELAATCPPRVQDRPRRQGRAQGGRPPGDPAEVIDRPKGYFPVPALTHLEGPTSTWCATRCTRRRPRSAGCSGPTPSSGCSPTPTAGSPRCAATSCGRSGCSSCGCSGTASRGRRMTDVDRATARPSRSHHPWPARRLPPAPGRRDGRGRGARLGLGPTDFRPDLRRPRGAGRGAAPGGPRPPRHLHLCPRVARVGRRGHRTSCSSTPATPTGCGSPARSDRTSTDPDRSASRCARWKARRTPTR